MLRAGAQRASLIAARSGGRGSSIAALSRLIPSLGVGAGRALHGSAPPPDHNDRQTHSHEEWHDSLAFVAYSALAVTAYSGAGYYIGTASDVFSFIPGEDFFGRLALTDAQLAWTCLGAGAGLSRGAAAMAALARLTHGERPVYARPQATEHGVGLVCIREVPAGAAICDTSYDLQFREVSGEDFARLHPVEKTFYHELFDPVSTYDTYILPGNPEVLHMACFVNHSSTPTCQYDANHQRFVAKHQLQPGDEITVDYTRYLDEHKYNYRKSWAHT
jgi:hypothetical protein